MVRRFNALFLFILMILVSPAIRAAEGHRSVASRSSAAIAAHLRQLPSVIEEAVKQGKLPGAVVVVGHNGRVVYHLAVGYRRRGRRNSLLHMNTIFDMASCTKVVATTTA
ncbi:MAG: serine hydrolase, partial [Acidobacteriota bacterium]